MSKKLDHAAHGPSWAEVILGAVLSLVLGVVLGAVLLVVRPAVVVKELPKEEDRVRGAVYFIEGSKETAKARQAVQKRAAFLGGQSVSLTEDEINAIANPGATAAAAGAKGGEKGKAPDKGKVADKGKAAEKAAPAAAAGEAVALGAPNFRIRDGSLQLAVPVTLNTMDLGLKVWAQARGTFAKEGDVFVFEPAEMYLGSCPVQRLPFLSSYVREKVIAGQSIPDDIKTAWKKLAGVAIEGSTLKLTMP
jgi:hypothetical protein